MSNRDTIDCHFLMKCTKLTPCLVDRDNADLTGWVLSLVVAFPELHYGASVSHFKKTTSLNFLLEDCDHCAAHLQGKHDLGKIPTIRCSLIL